MKRGAAHGLRKARRLYRRRNFTQVINFLEPQVFMYRDSYDYYYLLGMSCLYTGDYSGAYSYLRRALDIDDNVNAMLGLGAVLLRQRQTDQALRTYLDIIDLDNHNRRARRALQWLRGLDSPEEALKWFESNRVRRILPPIGLFLPRWVTVPVAGTAIVGLVLLVRPQIETALGDLFAPPDREGSEFIVPGDFADSLVSAPDEERFQFTQQEAERLLRRVGDYFNDRRDNLVRRELNRIRLSNASPAIRERAEMLRSYLTEPDFTSLADSFSYDQVSDDPALYADVYVRWRGRVANLNVGTEEITFDFLAGYHERRVLEGIVPARVQFAVLLENDQPVELIGRVVPKQEGDDFSLQVTSIRRLNPSELSLEE
ncbi:MAG: tetratricopeptide repeat protein [Alkalispirochaeta sp.]